MVAESLTNAAKHAGATRVDGARSSDGGAAAACRGRSTTARAAPTPRGSGLTGLRQRVEALDGTFAVTSPAGRAHHRAGGAAVRVVIAEDLALLRDGLGALLRDNDIDVVAAVDDPTALIEAVARERPDVAIVDVRLPPTFTDEGLRAALELRERRARAPPSWSCRSTSSGPTPTELLADGGGGVGYLLKDRIFDVRRLRRGRAPRRRRRHGARPRGGRPARSPRRQRAPRRSTGSPTREREVLGLMAEGRSNGGDRRRRWCSAWAPSRSTSPSIFTKLDLAAAPTDHRRVLAVLAYLGGDERPPSR